MVVGLPAGLSSLFITSRIVCSVISIYLLRNKGKSKFQILSVNLKTSNLVPPCDGDQYLLNAVWSPAASHQGGTASSGSQKSNRKEEEGAQIQEESVLSPGQCLQCVLHPVSPVSAGPGPPSGPVVKAGEGDDSRPGSCCAQLPAEPRDP